MTKIKRFSICFKTKNDRWWRVDKYPHTLREARELVKSLRANGHKAFYKPW